MLPAQIILIFKESRRCFGKEIKNYSFTEITAMHCINISTTKTALLLSQIEKSETFNTIGRKIKE